MAITCLLSEIITIFDALCFCWFLYFAQHQALLGMSSESESQNIVFLYSRLGLFLNQKVENKRGFVFVHSISNQWYMIYNNTTPFSPHAHTHIHTLMLTTIWYDWVFISNCFLLVLLFCVCPIRMCGLGQARHKVVAKQPIYIYIYCTIDKMHWNNNFSNNVASSFTYYFTAKSLCYLY